MMLESIDIHLKKTFKQLIVTHPRKISQLGSLNRNFSLCLVKSTAENQHSQTSHFYWQFTLKIKHFHQPSTYLSMYKKNSTKDLLLEQFIILICFLLLQLAFFQCARYRQHLFYRYRLAMNWQHSLHIQKHPCLN
jgi:hypothetical protein